MGGCGVVVSMTRENGGCDRQERKFFFSYSGLCRETGGTGQVMGGPEDPRRALRRRRRTPGPVTRVPVNGAKVG